MGSPSSGDRLAALAQTGLTASADPAFDRFAALVLRVLAVPVALVSLLEQDRQILPGAAGLCEPWQRRRQTPLSHSLCQYVVHDASSLVVEDARTDPRLAGSLAVTDLEVIAYAGMPLTDSDGLILGSLCAVDTVPRRWTADELSLLEDLAAACSDSLRLRIATQNARRRADSARATSVRASAATSRAQLLLTASAALARTNTVQDVVAAVRGLVTGTLDPAYVGISLVDATDRVILQSGSALPEHVSQRWRRYARSSATPSALAMRTGAPVLLPDPAAVHALTPEAAGTFAEMGWQSGASVPLPGPAGPLGALTFVWREPYVLDDGEQAVLAALAGYVAQALQRADHLTSRENTATVLQLALLSELPDPAPFELAARYEAAARSEQVGGDWYDAVRLGPRHLALVVGDVTGHDIGSAALMGRLRSKLRLLLVDRQEPPAASLRRLDAANQRLGDRITATAVLAHVRPRTGADGYELTWCNAGHPSPVVVDAGGISPLAGRDTLLGITRRTSLTTHVRPLAAGSTVLFYTDGLIENRSQPLDERERELHDVLALVGHLPLPTMLDEVYTRLAGGRHEDDVALLALRIPPAGREPGRS